MSLLPVSSSAPRHRAIVLLSPRCSRRRSGPRRSPDWWSNSWFPEFVPDLSLVAEVGGQIVGHVMISYAAIRHDGIESPIALLSPLGVAPQWQKRGVGSELVGRVTRLAEERGEPVVVLEGAPAFYGRLGFEFSVPYGIHISLPSWAPPEASQVLRLTGYTGSRGLVVLPPAFDAVTER